MENKTVYIISGPTAVGKSVIAYYLAKRVRGEIVNCDSIQLYRFMDIGSAKPSDDEMHKIRHHLYSIVDPDYNMTVATYQKLALRVIDDILERGRTPILCGGTGLYLNSILYDMNFAGHQSDPARRLELEKMAEEMGGDYMHKYLEALDADSASRIHPNNTRKVIRAIEAYELGNGIRDLSDCRINPNYDFRFIALTMDRQWLYDRINKRVVRLIKDGLTDEVRWLLEQGYSLENPSMKGIGYKEMVGYIKGEYSLDEAKDLIMKNTRHYAKRQLTWLRRYGDVSWIEIEKGESVGSIVDKILAVDNGQTDDR